MKKVRRMVSAAVSIVLIFQLVFLNTAAYGSTTLTEEQWQTKYDSLISENTLPLLCTGRNETELNLTWHALKDRAYPEVKLSRNRNMTGAVLFRGVTCEAENEKQLVCKVTMTGIRENTKYYYSYHSEKGWSEAFEYCSKGFDSFKMMVVGDVQIGGQTEDNADEQSRIGYVWQSLLNEALAENPDVSFLLSPGDNTSTGTHSDEWQTFMMPEQLRSLPVALAIGNHDKKGFSYNYYTNMPNEYFGKYFEGLDRDFWFTYGDALFLVFDATSGDAYDHRAMAEEAVKANPQCKWRIAVMHQALYGAGPCVLEPETMILLNAVFQPIFTMYDVDYVFTGHSHAQSRSHFISHGIVSHTAKSGGTYTDPAGIIYQNCNACCDQWGTKNNLFCDFTLDDEGYPTYSTVEFTGNTMQVKTFRGDNSRLLDSITIEKTKGFKDSPLLLGLRKIKYKPVELLGLIYMRIDAVVVKIRGGHF